MPPLYDLAIIPITVALVIGIWRFRRLNKPLRGIVLLVFCELFIEIAGRVSGKLLGTNMFLIPIDTILEFGLLGWVYRQVLAPSAVSRGLPVVVALFTAWGLLSYLWPSTLYEFNTTQRFVESLLVLGLVLLYFYKVIRELLIVHLEREPMFWVSLGLLIYFAGNLFIFISSNYVLQRSPALSLRFWAIHAVFYMILNSLFTLALWIAPSKKK